MKLSVHQIFDCQKNPGKEVTKKKDFDLTCELRYEVNITASWLWEIVKANWEHFSMEYWQCMLWDKIKQKFELCTQCTINRMDFGNL